LLPRNSWVLLGFGSLSFIAKSFASDPADSTTVTISRLPEPPLLVLTAPRPIPSISDIFAPYV
jgi:hypothetical protein